MEPFCRKIELIVHICIIEIISIYLRNLLNFFSFGLSLSGILILDKASIPKLGLVGELLTWCWFLNNFYIHMNGLLEKKMMSCTYYIALYFSLWISLSSVLFAQSFLRQIYYCWYSSLVIPSSLTIFWGWELEVV